MTEPFYLIELNELNFEFVRRYAEAGLLPNFGRLLKRCELGTTFSETAYENVEPWIQWVTAHTGKTFDEHRVFRLGDIIGADLDQIWEVLERSGVKVGAVSPMNAENRLIAPAFFVPDPWTPTRVSADGVTSALYKAIARAVSDNADGRMTPQSLARLLIGFFSHVPSARWMSYLRLARRIPSCSWVKAVILDRLLADVFLSLMDRTRPQFASLFLNAAAHIQHHYMYSSSVYSGDRRNPDWYVSSGEDPVLDIYAAYDLIVGDILDFQPEARVVIATGLHQDPYPIEDYYWRLKDHTGFLSQAGIAFVSIEPLMSRDFVMKFCNPSDARQAEDILRAARLQGDDSPVFETDNRSDSMFCTLVYPRELRPGSMLDINGKRFDLHKATVFVALKNGHHNPIGYLIDTAASRKPEQIPLGDLFHIVRRHFESGGIAA
jgi:hypothetical protein